LFKQQSLFEYEDEAVEPLWVRVNAKAVRVENNRQFGGPWLALQLIEQLKLDEFLNKHLSKGKEHIQWSLTSMILVIARLLDPSSELYVSEQWYPKTALPDLLGVPVDRGDDNRLYRALDELVPHKEALEIHLKNRMGELFDIEYNLLLYDVTSTFFEGQCNLKFLRQENRRYIIGTNKALLEKFEQELLKADWTTIRDGIEVKLCKMPKDENFDSTDEVSETFILCRSRDRKEKDKAIVQRAADKIAERLSSMKTRCEKQNRDQLIVSREIGRLLGQNTRASHLFDVKVLFKDKKFALIEWQRIKPATDLHELSDGCYLLRTNVTDWSDEDLWKAYKQLTEAENAFRIQKSDLSIRPVWHQKKERVRAHIFVCFLSYVLRKMLGQLCKKAGLGDEPRRVISELSEIRLVDVVLPTDSGHEIRTSCVTRPTEYQKILLDMLGFRLPARIRTREMV